MSKIKSRVELIKHKKHQKHNQLLHVLNCVYPYLLIIGIVIGFLYYQIATHTFIGGADSWFHMNQFYDTMMQIKTHKWNYFLTCFGFGQFGRIINAVYGPIFMYVNGLIFLIVKSWFNLELTQDFIFTSLSGIFFYWLARQNHISNWVSTLVGIMYMLSTPVLSWVNEQEFSGVGAMLLPLILMCATAMVRNKQIKPIHLVLVIALATQIHILSALIGCIIIVPFFIYTCFRTKHLGRLFKNLGISILYTILLTGNIWSILIQLSKEYTVPPIPQNMPVDDSSIIFHASLANPAFLLDTSDVILYGLIIILGVLGIIFWHHSDTLFKITFISSLFYAWVSSKYFFWKFILQIYPQYRYQIQFPKRFLPSAIGLLLLSFGFILSNQHYHVLSNKHVVTKWLCNILKVGSIAFIFFGCMDEFHQLSDQANIFHSNSIISYGLFHSWPFKNAKHVPAMRRDYFSTKPKSVKHGISVLYQDTGDYLPAHNQIKTYTQYRQESIFSGIQNQLYNPSLTTNFHRYVRSHKLILKWHQKHSHYIDILPVVKYHNTHLILNGHHLHHVKTTQIGAPIHYIHHGWNKLTMYYTVPMWITFIFILTYVSWLTLLAVLVI